MRVDRVTVLSRMLSGYALDVYYVWHDAGGLLRGGIKTKNADNVRVFGGGGGGVGEGHCTLNLSINAIFPILILRTAEVPENYTKPPRGPKKRTSAPVLTQKHSDDV